MHTLDEVTKPLALHQNGPASHFQMLTACRRSHALGSVAGSHHMADARYWSWLFLGASAVVTAPPHLSKVPFGGVVHVKIANDQSQVCAPAHGAHLFRQRLGRNDRAARAGCTVSCTRQEEGLLAARRMRGAHHHLGQPLLVGLQSSGHPIHASCCMIGHEHKRLLGTACRGDHGANGSCLLRAAP